MILSRIVTSPEVLLAEWESVCLWEQHSISDLSRHKALQPDHEDNPAAYLSSYLTFLPAFISGRFFSDRFLAPEQMRFVESGEVYHGW
jgi:hypothetical protein